MEKSEVVKAEDAEFINEILPSNVHESRIYSTRNRSSDGLSEKERKYLETQDIIPCGKYKKRHLK